MLTATNRSNIKISKEIELKRFSEKISKFIKQFNTIFKYIMPAIKNSKTKFKTLNFI